MQRSAVVSPAIISTGNTQKKTKKTEYKKLQKAKRRKRRGEEEGRRDYVPRHGGRTT
jgi:hypothetical protein